MIRTDTHLLVGVHGEGHIRLSYANSAENIQKALKRMNEFLVTRKPD